MFRIQRNVCLASAEQHQHVRKVWHDHERIPLRFRCGGRCSTIRMTLLAFAKRVGNPHECVPIRDWRRYDLPLLDGAGKVSASWYFWTPRGPVEVSDYWWNKEDELSVRASDMRAMRWFLRWCKLQNIPTE